MSVSGNDNVNALEILTQAEALGHLGAWALDVSSGRFWWSDEVYRICGLPPQESPATLTALLSLVHPDDRMRVQQLLHLATTDHVPFRDEHRIVRPDGEVRHVRAECTFYPEIDGRPARVLGMVLDVSDEHQLRQAAADVSERYRLLAEHAYDVVWTMELDGSISYVSPAIERVRGFTAEEARSQTLEQVNTPESAARVMEYFTRLQAAMQDGAPVPSFHDELEYYHKDGSVLLSELHVTPQVDADGRVVRILGVSRDISERKRYELELNRLAVTDPLTGVSNRRHGEALLNSDIEESRRYETPVTLLMFDVDHFKSINDTYGHQIGDLVLMEVSRRLSSNLRPSDAIVRWGGEEFLVIARHCALEAGVALAEKIRELLASTAFEHVGMVTASFGVAELASSDDLDSWLHRADQAMYEAKLAGRNSVRSH